MDDDLALTRRLEARAGGIDARPDHADLLDRVRSRDRRRQGVLSGALIVALIAGPLAGMAVERGLRPDVDAVAAGGGVELQEDGDRSEAGAAATTTTAAGADTASGDAMVGSFVAGSSGPSSEMEGISSVPLERIGRRTVDEVDVRLYAVSYGTADDGNPFWDAPPGCNATGALSIQVSSQDFVAVLGADRYGNPERVDGTVGLAGVAEGDPRWVVVAEVGAADASVTFPDGQVGSGTGIEGIVVATAPAPGHAGVEQGEHGFEATVTAGSTSHAVSTWSGPSEELLAGHCQPPPSLPEPGQQPASPAAQTAAIGTALTTAFTDQDREAQGGAVQHPEVVLPAMDQLAVNYPGLVATPTLGELVFTGETNAFYYFDLDTDIIDYYDQIGEAVLVDDRWVVATETMCTQLRKGGATCEVPEER